MTNINICLFVDKLMSIEDPKQRMDILTEVSKSFTKGSRDKIMKEIISRIK